MTTELNPGFKRTEAGVIPSDWAAGPLGEFVEITSGESPSRFHFLSEGTPYYKVEQLNNGLKYQDETPYFISTSKSVKKGSLIFPKRGASILLNKIRILRENSFMDTNLMTLTPNEKLDAEYLYYNLSHLGLWRVADTTSIPQINNKHIKPLFVPIPSMKEQRAIATALSDMDALINGLDQLIAKKRDIKQATMQQLLTGQTRLPGFSGEWEVKRLGDVVEIRKGQLITEKTVMAGDIPVIAGGKKPAYFHNTANRKGKTITVSASGASAGYVAFFDSPIFASDCSTIGEGHGYSIEFIYYQLQLLQEQIYKAQTGGAQPHIHAVDLIPLTIGYPSYKEQVAIAEVLSETDSELCAVEARRDKAKQIKQGMMQELLTGRIRLV